jgi:hypothetical protein
MTSDRARVDGSARQRQGQPRPGHRRTQEACAALLDQKEIRALYHRVEKDSNNFGRVFVHFRWK